MGQTAKIVLTDVLLATRKISKESKQDAVGHLSRNYNKPWNVTNFELCDIFTVSDNDAEFRSRTCRNLLQ